MEARQTGEFWLGQGGNTKSVRGGMGIGGIQRPLRAWAGVQVRQGGRKGRTKVAWWCPRTGQTFTAAAVYGYPAAAAGGW